MGPEDVQANQPLTETTFFILRSLAALQKHGYAVAKDIESLSDPHGVLSMSTLSAALKRMLEEGWIARAEEDPEPDETARPRKTVSLTIKGVASWKQKRFTCSPW